jgi:hypothetical protein
MFKKDDLMQMWILNFWNIEINSFVVKYFELIATFHELDYMSHPWIKPKILFGPFSINGINLWHIVISYTITLFPNVKISPTMCHDGHNLSLGLKQELQQDMEKGLGRRPRHDMAQTHSQFESWEFFLKFWDPWGKVWRIKSCLNKIQYKNEICIFEWHYFNCIIFIYWEVTESIILALIYVF